MSFSIHWTLAIESSLPINNSIESEEKIKLSISDDSNASKRSLHYKKKKRIRSIEPYCLSIPHIIALEINFCNNDPIFSPDKFCFSHLFFINEKRGPPSNNIILKLS
jgi:hypothetical protein